MARIHDLLVVGIARFLNGQIVDGDLQVGGNIISKLNTTGIDLGITVYPFAKKINLLNFNEEVILFTVPVGKQAMIGNSIPQLCMFYSEYAGTLTGAADLSITYKDVDGNTVTLNPWLTVINGKGYYNSAGIGTSVIGAGDVKVKVVQQNTGLTSAMLVIAGTVIF